MQLARRLANLGNSPFIKVEATQYTEVGYHGKDVDNIINDLAGLTIRNFRETLMSQAQNIEKEMEDLINLFLLDFLVGTETVDEEVRIKKLENIEKGLYDDVYVNVEIPRDVDLMKFDSIEDYLSYITNIGT